METFETKQFLLMLLFLCEEGGMVYISEVNWQQSNVLWTISEDFFFTFSKIFLGGLPNWFPGEILKSTFDVSSLSVYESLSTTMT